MGEKVQDDSIKCILKFFLKKKIEKLKHEKYNQGGAVTGKW